MFDLFPALGACGSFDPEKRVNSPTRTETVLSKKSMYMLSGGFTGGREGMKFAFIFLKYNYHSFVFLCERIFIDARFERMTDLEKPRVTLLKRMSLFLAIGADYSFSVIRDVFP
jgi:hypothetical protein